MTREEHKNLIQSIMKNANNQAELSMLLTQLSDVYETVLTASETATASVSTLTADNERLRDVNMQLFLKVGHEKPADETENKGQESKEEPKLSFDELFDENGGLK